MVGRCTKIQPCNYQTKAGQKCRLVITWLAPSNLEGHTGFEALLLSEWVKYHSTRRPNIRIPGPMYSLIAQTSLEHPRLSMALLKVVLETGPYVGVWAKGVSTKLIEAPFAKAVKDSQTRVALEVAECILNILRERLAKAGVQQLPTEDIGLVKVLGAADLKVGKIILGLADCGKHRLLSIIDAGHTCVRQLARDDAFKHGDFSDMSAALKQEEDKATERVKAWTKLEQEEQAARAKAPSKHLAASDKMGSSKAPKGKHGPGDDDDDGDSAMLTMVLRNSSGVVSDAPHRLHMKDMGVFSIVHCRKAGLTAAIGQYTVHAITETAVSIQDGSGEVVEVPLKEFETHFKAGKMGADGEPVPAQGWPQNNTCDRPDVLLTSVIGAVQDCVGYAQHAFMSDFAKKPTNFSVIEAPIQKKGVFVTKNADAEIIVITPDTTNVKMVEERHWSADPLPLKKGVEARWVASVQNIPNVKFFLEPVNTPKLRALFWAIAPTSNLNKANMKLGFMKIDSWKSHDIEYGRGECQLPQAAQREAIARVQDQMRRLLQEMQRAGGDISIYEAIGREMEGVRGLFPETTESSASGGPAQEQMAGHQAEGAAVATSVAKAPGLSPTAPVAAKSVPTKAKAPQPAKAKAPQQHAKATASVPVSRGIANPRAALWQTISIPFLTNSRPVVEGEELRYYEEPFEKKVAQAKAAGKGIKRSREQIGAKLEKAAGKKARGSHD